MNTNQSSVATRMKVGLFTLVGLLLIGATTVFVNDRPFWWRPCQLVHINVEDATGLKTKSPIRSLGLEIGYLHSVELVDSAVNLGICITAPVEVLPTTKAYIRGEGFLGDKFVELKPVRYVGDQQKRVPSSKLPGTITLGLAWIVSDALAADPEEPETPPMPEGDETPEAKPSPAGVPVNPAAPRPARPVTRGRPGERNIPVGKSTEDVQQLVNRVDELVDQMTGLTNNLKKAINPEELRTTMRQLNTTLANASRTFSPEGGLNQTAQRTLAKLEDAIEQMRDMITRVNKGEGSVGMLLNDPAYAQELKAAAENINRLLGRVGSVRFVVDIGAEQMRGYDDGRGWFRLGIWPSHDRYYLLGITVDPRGRLTHTLTTTTVAGQSTTTETLVTEKTGFLFTAMVGKVFWNRLDLSVGALHGDGTLSASIWFGPNGREDLLQLRNDVYSRGPAGSGIDDRVTVTVKIWKAAYLKGGFEGFRKVGGALPWIYGAGVSFDDEDIKLLFALR